MEHSAEGGSNPAKQPHEIEPEGQRGGGQKGGQEHRIGGKYAVRLHIFGHDEAGHGGGRTGHNENGDHLAVLEAHGSGQRQENCGKQKELDQGGDRGAFHRGHAVAAGKQNRQNRRSKSP